MDIRYPKYRKIQPIYQGSTIRHMSKRSIRYPTLLKPRTSRLTVAMSWGPLGSTSPPLRPPNVAATRKRSSASSPLLITTRAAAPLLATLLACWVCLRVCYRVSCAGVCRGSSTGDHRRLWQRKAKIQQLMLVVSSIIAFATRQCAA